MKNTIIVLLAIFIGYYFWPEPQSPQQTELSDEDFYEEELEPEEPIAVHPKKQAERLKPIVEKNPTPRKAPAQKIVIRTQAPPKKLEWYKSKEPPKNIAFKVDKKGNAIAFGDIYLGKVTTPIKGIGQTKPKPVKLWDSTEIPFFIDKSIPTNQAEVILATLDYFSDNTNLTFIKNDGSYKDSIVFIKGDEHCYSYLGKVGGHQPIHLSRNCQENEIAHEVMHALGYIHEHTRTDRDNYVTIHWDNVQKGFENQFSLVPKEYMIDTLAGFPFSYNSRMLYDPNFFAKNTSKPTISPKAGKQIISVGTILSPDDIQRINATY